MLLKIMSTKQKKYKALATLEKITGGPVTFGKLLRSGNSAFLIRRSIALLALPSSSMAKFSLSHLIS